MAVKQIRIHSRNDRFQYIETLRRNREKRQRTGEFFLEGVRSINLALTHGWQFNALVYAEDVPLSRWAEGIVKATHTECHYLLPASLMEEISGKEDTSELIALVAMPADELSRIPIQQPFTALVFDRPANPGNLGTLIRSCDAMKVSGMVITGHAVDLYSPETINASTGSFFALPVVRQASSRHLLPWFATIREQLGDLCVVGTDEKGMVDIADHDFLRPTILLAGNETWGLSKTFREICDVMAHIPISGSASSLNVACALSIVLYEINRQRMRTVNTAM